VFRACVQYEITRRWRLASEKEPALELYIIINNAASEISVFHTNVLFECVCVRVCACVCGYAPLPVTCRVDEQT
jgi:hypothetical protein